MQINGDEKLEYVCWSVIIFNNSKKEIICINSTNYNYRLNHYNSINSQLKQDIRAWV